MPGGIRVTQSFRVNITKPEWKRGDRVILVYTDDPYTKLKPGAEGTVTGWEPVTSELFMRWDQGSKLSMLLADGDVVLWVGHRTGEGT